MYTRFSSRGRRTLVVAVTVLLALAGLTGTASAQPARSDDPTRPGVGACPASTTATATGPASVTIAGPPQQIAVTPDQRYAWVTGGNSVSVVDLRTRAVAATIPVDPVPLGITMNRSGTTAYVANGEAGRVTTIDTRTRTVTSVASAGEFPVGVAVRTTRTGDQLYVADNEGDAVALLDAATGNELRRWAIRAPAGVVLTGGGTVVAPSSSDGDVLTIDARSGTSTTLHRPDQLATNPGSLSATGDTVVLPSDAVTWLNAATGAFSGSVPSIAPGITSDGVVTPGARWTVLTTRDFDDSDPPQPGNLSVVDNRTHQRISTRPLGLRPSAVAMTRTLVLVAQGPGPDGSSTLQLIPVGDVLPRGR